MKIEWKSCFRLGVTVFLTFLAIHYWSSLTGFVGALVGAASALILGCVIAYVLNILMSFYEKHYFPKSKSEAVKKSKRIGRARFNRRRKAIAVVPGRSGRPAGTRADDRGQPASCAQRGAAVCGQRREYGRSVSGGLHRVDESGGSL